MIDFDSLIFEPSKNDCVNTVKFQGQSPSVIVTRAPLFDLSFSTS